MATFDMNRRGGFTVDRDSLHASDGYKRQVEALKQLRERTMNADAEKAVERLDLAFSMCGVVARNDDWHTIRQALRDQEAEIARLKAQADTHRDGRLRALERLAKAEALLREAYPFVPITWSSTGQPQLHANITAHLGAEK